MSLRMRCPHCGEICTARSSKELTRTMREIYYRCNNLECGHTYVASLEVQRTLSPSAVPNMTVHVPLSPHVRRRDLMRQLELSM